MSHNGRKFTGNHNFSRSVNTLFTSFKFYVFWWKIKHQVILTKSSGLVQEFVTQLLHTTIYKFQYFRYAMRK